MIYWILLMVLLIVTVILIVAIKKDLKSSIIIILLSQIYNFIIGFFSWIIYFINMIFLLTIFNDKINIYLCYILSGIISIILLLILLVPINIKINKKTRANYIKYIAISSIFIIILGMITFLMFSNLEL